jgi:hypothetical protein
MGTSPLGVLAALVIVGVTIEVVEGQDKRAAYALVVLLLLGIITFNAARFRTEISALIATFNAPSRPSQSNMQH